MLPMPPAPRKPEASALWLHPLDLLAGALRYPPLVTVLGLVWLVLMALLVAALLAPLHAAETAVVAARVNWAPLANVVIEVAATVLMVLLGWLLVRLKAKVNVDIDEGVRTYLRDGLEKAVEYGYQAEERRVTELQRTDPTAKVDMSRVLQEGLGYALRQVPGAIAHFDLTPDRVRDMLVARLPPVT